MHLLNTLIIVHTHINLITYTNLNTPKSHAYINLQGYIDMNTHKHLNTYINLNNVLYTYMEI